MSAEKEANVYPPSRPRRPEREEDRHWPPPTPLPCSPAPDIGRLLKRILDQLDAIEKRLENIEKVLKTQRSL